MSLLQLAFGAALLSAIGHSFLSEKLFLRPLRLETVEGSVFSGESQKKLVTAMFHAASLFWITMATSLLLLEPGTAGYRSTLHLFATAFAVSGFGNFWAVGRPHPGGFMLLTASTLVLASLHT